MKQLGETHVIECDGEIADRVRVRPGAEVSEGLWFCEVDSDEFGFLGVLEYDELERAWSFDDGDEIQAGFSRRASAVRALWSAVTR